MSHAELSASPPPIVPRETRGLALLFGTMYFVQGIAEPTEGLIAQPVRSLLDSWGHSVGEIAAFSAVISLPWSLKPLYGLLTDFLPLGGTRRRGYLLLSAGMTFLGLAYLYLNPPSRGGGHVLLALLLVPTIGVAFADVVVDALMVEKGQPTGLTGRLQSVQWGAMYAATILAGVAGGYLSQHGQQQLGFLICAGFSLVTLAVAWIFVKEPPHRTGAVDFRRAAAALSRAARSPMVLAAAAFIFLWSFNPFNTAVLQLYSTNEVGLSEQFYGTTISLFAVGAIGATIFYGRYCRIVPRAWLIHGAIVAGIVSTLAYWGYRGETSAVLISLFVGFSYMAGLLVLLDLAAQACPLESAGTTFALLMGLSNLSSALSTAVGGWWYERWSSHWGPPTAFNLLVLAGAAATSTCWLLVPWLKPRR